MKTEFNTDIEQMLLNSSFDNLSQQEQEIILSEMTKQDYEMYQSLIQEAQMLKGPVGGMSPKVLMDIKSQLGDQLVSEKTIIEKVTTSRMPAWLGVTLALLGFGISHFFQILNNSNTPVAVPETQFVTVVDTLFIDRIDTIYIKVMSDPIIKIEEVIKIQEVIIEKEGPVANNPQIPKHIPEDQKAYYAGYETPDLLARKTGQSVGTSQEIMELLDSK